MVPNPMPFKRGILPAIPCVAALFLAFASLAAGMESFFFLLFFFASEMASFKLVSFLMAIFGIGGGGGGGAGAPLASFMSLTSLSFDAIAMKFIYFYLSFNNTFNILRKSHFELKFFSFYVQLFL
jgi:hypothetical protein